MDTYQREESEHIKEVMELQQNLSHNKLYIKGLLQNYLFHWCSYLCIRLYRNFLFFFFFEKQLIALDYF